MSFRDWVVALQVPLFVVVLIPAWVGASLALQAGAPVPPLTLGLVLLVLVLIQGGANLQKGLVESQDRRGEAAAITSPFVFDSGAVERLNVSRGTVRALTLALFIGAGLGGLYLVLTVADLLLLGLGLAGALLGFFYSAPPLKLSYRGIGEVATFLAFGPLLVMGVTYLFARSFPSSSLWAGIILGFLASVISFARYFPVAAEDAGKGKRTPVVILGARRATLLLWALLGAPFLTAGVATWLGASGMLLLWAAAPVALAVALFHRRGAAGGTGYGHAVGAAVLLHALTGLLLLPPLP